MMDILSPDPASAQVLESPMVSNLKGIWEALEEVCLPSLGYKKLELWNTPTQNTFLAFILALYLP